MGKVYAALDSIMIVNPSVIVFLLSEKFGVRNPASFGEEVNNDEHRLAEVLSDLMDQSSHSQCEIDEDIYLHDGLDDDEDEEEGVSEQPLASTSRSSAPQQESESSSSSSEDETQQSSSTSYEPSPKKAIMQRIDQSYTLDQIKTIIEFVDKRGNAAAFKRWSSLNNSAAKIARIRGYLESGGHRLSKLDQLKNIVYTHFRTARDGFLPVHGHDLKSWSIEAARIVKLPNFKASVGFLHSLKTQFKITSRKVTKFITKKTRVNEADIKKSADEFVIKINELKENMGYRNANVWNTDQSGFNYELVSGRTLSDRGEKETFAMVQNINSLTHSYKIQVLISNDGHLAPKLFICFKKPVENLDLE